jgi:DNA-binding LacI/PurR family transcriptional regulator
MSADTRERVLEAARELGYSGPDPSGRRLRTGRSGALGLLFTASLPYAFTDAAATLFLRGVARGVEEAEAGLLIISGSPTHEDPAKVVREAAVDGFLAYSMPTDDPRVQAALARHVPVVTIDQPRDLDTPFVGIDDRAAARDGARHLDELGHEQVAILSFVESANGQGERPFDLTGERLAGYRDVYPDASVYTAFPNSLAAGREQTLKALDAGATAVLAMSDALALGALQAARERGTRLSVVGFDDSPIAALAAPPLTTVAQPHEQKGETAARLLIDAIAGTATPAPRTILPHELIVRGSTFPVN